LAAELERRGVSAEVLDGDIVRRNLSKGLGFSKEDRDTNIRRIAFVAHLLTRNGAVCITAAISPYRAIRDEARALIGSFVEVHANAPLEVCEARDPKGLYRKARAGELTQFTGIDDPYEAPRHAEVVCHTDVESPEESVAKVVVCLERSGHIPARSGVTGIAPHGGSLVDRLAAPDELPALLHRARMLPAVEVNDVTARDTEMIGVGAFSPLSGFMGSEDYEAVLERGRLASGLPWTVPVTCDAREIQAGPGDDIALVDARGATLAILTVEEVFTRDPRREALAVYRTDDAAGHPGVARVFGESTRLVAGPITVLDRNDRGAFGPWWSDPAETRALFAERGWKTIVAFQTRNPVHRAHEYIQKCALETCDGLLLHPIVGDTKKDDIPAEVRMECYRALLDGYYPADRALLRVLPTAMRYAGPKEAIFHAIVRKNYGCTHFIVGRDHAGVGNYYGTFDAHRIFQDYGPEELGITPLFFDNAMYCRQCGGMATRKTCPHDASNHVFLSGTKVRELLATGEELPGEFTRPEVAEVLRAAYSGPDRGS
jgi:sulfate adenylyltransferase/3'-phosphoadenosine 5'-phosphosulfate synthase